MGSVKDGKLTRMILFIFTDKSVTSDHVSNISICFNVINMQNITHNKLVYSFSCYKLKKEPYTGIKYL